MKKDTVSGEEPVKGFNATKNSKIIVVAVFRTMFTSMACALGYPRITVSSIIRAFVPLAGLATIDRVEANAKEQSETA